MSKGTDAALRLVVVDDSVEDAEAIVSGLRNAGIAARRPLCAQASSQARPKPTIAATFSVPERQPRS